MKLACLLCAGLLLAQEPRFKGGVSLVRVDAEVTDGTRTLTGLVKDDFRILDNGQPKEILHFSDGEEPLDLMLLFDVSGSMRSAVRKIAASARVALTSLRPGDRVGAMAFAWSSRLVMPLTEDLASIESAINDGVLAKVGGGTHIMTAVDDAGSYFLNVPKAGRRRVVLIVTDNVGSRTRRENNVVRKYWEADVVLAGIILETGFLKATRYYRAIAPQQRLLQQGMTGVAEKTGGDSLRGGDPVELFTEMIHRIRQRYSIYYRMPEEKAGASRTVKVDLSPEAKQRLGGARVRARKGYIVPAV